MTTFDPTSARWRRVRGGLLAVVAAQLAALGHLAGGGGAPDPSSVLAAAALIALAGTGLARRRQGIAGIAATLTGSQLLFHGLFSLSHHSETLNLGRMVLFHLLAAALSTVVLARGEAMLFRLVGLWRRIRQRASIVLRPQPSIGWSVRVSTRLTRPALRVLRRHPRRGPPALLPV